jgi:diguanylate cyclase (GGDEF)-like protein
MPPVTGTKSRPKSALWPWLKKRGDVNLAIALFSLALIAYIWVAAITEGRAERDEAIAAAVKQNSNLAVAYEEHMIRTLNGLDAVTRFVRHEYQRLGARMDLDKYISDGVIDRRIFSILSVVDARGDIVFSSNAVARVNYADRDHFQTHVGRNSDALYISKPVFGRVSGTWQIPMSRRIDKPDGTFGGIVVISVDPEYFTHFYQKADIGTEGLVALVGLDGIARARRVGRKLSFGDDLSTSGLLQEQATSPTGSFRNAGRLDGVTRYVSYRTLADYPLVVAVATAEDEVLSRYANNRLRAYRTALLVSAVIAIFAALLLWAVTRQKRATAALAEDIAERKRLEAELRELAATDMLTELPNRRHFLARLEEEHARLRRFDTLQDAVLMLDLDFFKRVNDTYGHATGDEVLRHCARLISNEIRQIDSASRLGGEEFAVILPGATPTAALEFAERLRRKVAESVTEHDGETIRVTVSIGVSSMSRDDHGGEDALARADLALYRAKAAGRNRVEVESARGAALSATAKRDEKE